MEGNLNVGPVTVLPDASSVVRSPAPPQKPESAAEPVRFAEASTVERASPAIEHLRQQQQANTPSGVRIRVDDATSRFVAQIVNQANEVIKQIPPEEALRAAARFRAITGLIFDLEI